MESQTPGQKTDAQREDEADQRSTGFQDEFDKLLLWLIGIGLVLTILYGASARTCEPDPQQLPAVAAAPAGRAAPKQASPPAQQPPPRTPTPAQSATQPAAAPTPAVPRPAAATQPQRAEQQPRANVTFPLRPPCVGEGNGTVGALLALAIAMAALALGTFVGFLFGLPRTLTSSEVRASRRQAASQNVAEGGSPDSAGADAGGPGTGSDVNTNLEKISDWLTTIIVGVGLTKLEDIPQALENFGDHVAPYFSYGGKVFGIAGGLFFLIAGFFLAYVGTRVKLSLVFVWSQRTNQGAATLSVAAQAVYTSKAAAPVQPPGSPAQEDDKLKDADRQILLKTWSDLKTSDEILAWANAKARKGDFASAVAAYKDLWGRTPLNDKQQTDYATVLAAAGDTAGAYNVVNTMATSGLAPEAEREVRQKVAAATQAGKAAELTTRLQQGLYKPPNERGYEDSIVAGKELLELGEVTDPWVYVWLASAYGQRHAALTAKADRTPEEQKQLDEAAARVVDLVTRALGLNPNVRPTLQGLYDPDKRVGDDDDLNSLRGNEALDALLRDKPAEAAEAEAEKPEDDKTGTPSAT